MGGDGQGWVVVDGVSFGISRARGMAWVRSCFVSLSKAWAYHVTSTGGRQLGKGKKNKQGMFTELTRYRWVTIQPHIRQL